MSVEKGFLVPYQSAKTEFTEKRSRFIGHIWRIDSEEIARQLIESVRKEHHAARHNCWAYLIHNDNIVRYSDDGEPQGTAGQAILNVLQQREVSNACCVVTRYFGGVLLGTGGLTRAYARAAKETLDEAGIALLRHWTCWEILCPYMLMSQIQREVESCGGEVSSMDFGAKVTVYAMFLAGREEAFVKHLRKYPADSVSAKHVGDVRAADDRIVKRQSAKREKKAKE